MLRLLLTQLLALEAAASTCDFTEYKIEEDGIPRYPNIVLKWNLFASETGMYEVDGCDGPSPTLKLRVGVKYKFVQADISNWSARTRCPFESCDTFLKCHFLLKRAVLRLMPQVPPRGLCL